MACPSRGSYGNVSDGLSYAIVKVHEGSASRNKPFVSVAGSLEEPPHLIGFENTKKLELYRKSFNLFSIRVSLSDIVAFVTPIIAAISHDKYP